MFPILSALVAAHKSIDRSLDSKNTREKATISDDEADDAFMHELQAMNGAKLVDDVIAAVAAKVAKIKEHPVKPANRPSKKRRLRKTEEVDLEDGDACQDVQEYADEGDFGADSDAGDGNVENFVDGDEDDETSLEHSISEAEDDQCKADETNVPWRPEIFMRVMRMAMADALTDGKPMPMQTGGHVFSNAALEAGKVATAPFWEDRDRILSSSSDPFVQSIRPHVAGTTDFSVAQTERGLELQCGSAAACLLRDPNEAELAAAVFFLENFYVLAKIRCCVLFTTMLSTTPGLSGRTVGEIAHSRAPDQLNMFADVHEQYLSYRACLVRAGRPS